MEQQEDSDSRVGPLDSMDNHLIFHVMQFLNLSETANLVCLLLSRSRGVQLRESDAFYNALCTSNYFLHQELISDVKPTNLSYKSYFEASIARVAYFRSTISKLIACVPNSETFFGQIQVEKAYSNDSNQLNSILSLAKKHYTRIPRDVLILYRVLNGQEQLKDLSQLFSTTIALFGYINYYDTQYLFYFPPFSAPQCGFLGAMKAHPFLKVYPEGKTLFLDITNKLQQPEPALYTFYPQQGNQAAGNRYLYIAHASMYSFMSKMRQTAYVDEQIQIIHNQGESPSDRTTNGIRIRVSAKHIYLDSHNTVDEFFYSYSVRISAESIPEGKKFKLTTRKWISLQDANPGKEEMIEGPGVIGQYPEMFNGCDDFTYSSCTVVKGRTGSMKGSFQFRELGTNHLFDAIIDPFPLQPDPDAKLISYYPQTGAVQQVYPISQS